MPPATTVVAASAVTGRTDPKVYPEGGGSEHKYVEEDKESLETKQVIRKEAVAYLGDEDRPMFVTDTYVIDPRHHCDSSCYVVESPAPCQREKIFLPSRSALWVRAGWTG